MRRRRHKLSDDQQLRLQDYLAEHPALTIHRFKQRLCYLLPKKHCTRKQCQQLVPRFLSAVYPLRQARPSSTGPTRQTLHSWSEEIVAMWRFTRNNGSTEAFHKKGSSSTAKLIAFETSKITDSE